MADPIVNMSRAKVTSPIGTFHSARFAYNSGRAAVWTEDRRTRTATRVLYATDAQLTKPRSARDPYVIKTGDEEWYIRQTGSGGG